MTGATSTRFGLHRFRSHFPWKTLIVVLMALTFVLGMVVGSRRPRWVPAVPSLATERAPAELGEASPRAVVGLDEGDGELASMGLWNELAVQRSRLERRETELRGEIREAEVALHLLRVRGQAVDAPACREQEAKVRLAGIALARLQQESLEAARLEGELRQAYQEDRTRFDRPAAESDVWGRVRVYLTRRSLMRQLSMPETIPGTAESKGSASR